MGNKELLKDILDSLNKIYREHDDSIINQRNFLKQHGFKIEAQVKNENAESSMNLYFQIRDYLETLQDNLEE